MINLVKVKLKNGQVFDGRKIYVQSMLNKAANLVDENVIQARQLENVGCEILRVAVPTIDDVGLIKILKKSVTIPIVADIHFNYKIAIEAVKNGADKIRINPANIGSIDNIKKIVDICKTYQVPIRIGINSGALENSVLENETETISSIMVASALKNIQILENLNFDQIVVSMKSTNVWQTIEAYRKLRKKCLYPFHLGITEAGTKKVSSIKSSIGIGILLSEKIGETLRVTITGDPVDEVEIGHLILKSLDLEKSGVEIISCPTCGRTKINLIQITKQLEEKTKHLKTPIKIAIMGCVVNGPGEAKNADLAIAGGDGCAMFYRKGVFCKKIDELEIVSFLLKEIEKIV